MNKSKQPMAAQLRKKMNKELKKATLQPEPILKSDVITPKDLLSRAPLKVRKKEISLQKSFKERLADKAQKKKSHVSKRTTPGTVDEKSPPHIVHVEGKRWIKTLEKQNVNKRKMLTRHLAKKGSK